jgi:hypothetical protein
MRARDKIMHIARGRGALTVRARTHAHTHAQQTHARAIRLIRYSYERRSGFVKWKERSRDISVKLTSHL